MSRTLRPLLGLAVLALTGAAAHAQVHSPLSSPTTVVRDVVLSADKDAAHVDITIHAGRIAAITPTGGELTPGAQLFEGEGMLVQPGFIDTWTTSGVELEPPVKDQDEAVSVRSDMRAAMRAANRKGIAPSARAADVLDFGADGAGAWRADGFGALLAAPSGELLAGHGVLAVTRKGPRRELILNPEVFQFGEFAARGGGYPSTIMGYFAQLRQFFYDAGWQAELEARFAAGSPDPRPVWDAELAAGTRLAAGRELYVVHADKAGDIERWMRLADEFQLRLAIAGGGEAWRVAALLKQRGIPVLLDLDFGEEVDDPNAIDEEQQEAADRPGDEEHDGAAMETPDESQGEIAGADEESETDAATTDDEADAEEADIWHYEEPLALKLERRRLWEEQRDNAMRLQEAGVRILFATGDRKPKELMADLRAAIEAGLDREIVRTALTADAARFLGLTGHAGELTVGHDASFGVWTADPLGDDASLAMMVVDGRVEEFDIDAPGTGPDEGVDASGTWTVSSDSEEAIEDTTLTIEMSEDGQVSGSLTMVSPMDGEEMSTSVKGSVSGSKLTLKGSFEMGGMEIAFKIKAELSGDALSGTGTWSGPWGESESNITGTRPPSRRHVHADDETETHYSCKD